MVPVILSTDVQSWKFAWFQIQYMIYRSMSNNHDKIFGTPREWTPRDLVLNSKHDNALEAE